MKLFLSVLMSIFDCGSVSNSFYSSSKFEQEITCEFLENFKAKTQKDPVLILIGGFSGSGKSSLVAQMKEVYDIHVISTDAIRQKLINKGKKIPELSKYVSIIYKNLMEHCLLNSSHICIDANAHSKRIREAKELIKENHSQCSVVKIFLNASQETLRNRVMTREPRAGCYNGTLIELEASLTSVDIDDEEYDLIVDTEKSDQNGVFEEVKLFLNKFLSETIHHLLLLERW